MTPAAIPHLRVVVSVSGFVLLGFAAVSIYVIGWSSDDVTKGNIIGSWLNFAMLVVGFWIGSSSAGKMKDIEPRQVEVMNAPDNPVPTIDETALPSPEFGPRPGDTQ